MSALLDVKNLNQRFTLSKNFLSGRSKCVYAVNNVSFSVNRGEVLSIVGESGCGKSTTARTIIKLVEPKEGKISYDGVDITNFNQQQMYPYRRRMQMIFQNPYASLNPRFTIRKILVEPILFHKLAGSVSEANEVALNILDKVGIRPEQADRFPHQFSGGQRQRISIARALVLNPEFIIADEPVSALDVSIQAQILNLLLDLKEEYHLSYLFIAHDLAVVKHISNRVAVMYLGKIVEIGNKADVYQTPLHPYTNALFASIPVLGRKNLQNVVLGDVPVTPTQLSNGCSFYSRCTYAKKICQESSPELHEYAPGHFAACHNI